MFSRVLYEIFYVENLQLISREIIEMVSVTFFTFFIPSKFRDFKGKGEKKS